MAGNDRDVLEFLGYQGKSPEAIAERFPGFDMHRLIARVGVANPIFRQSARFRRATEIALARGG